MCSLRKDCAAACLRCAGLDCSERSFFACASRSSSGRTGRVRERRFDVPFHLKVLMIAMCSFSLGVVAKAPASLPVGCFCPLRAQAGSCNPLICSVMVRRSPTCLAAVATPCQGPVLPPSPTLQLSHNQWRLPMSPLVPGRSDAHNPCSQVGILNCASLSGQTNTPNSFTNPVPPFQTPNVTEQAEDSLAGSPDPTLTPPTHAPPYWACVQHPHVEGSG
jgi:hypothetical protein